METLDERREALMAAIDLTPAPAWSPRSGQRATGAPSDDFLARSRGRTDRGRADRVTSGLVEPISACDVDLIRLLLTRLTNQVLV